MKKVLLWTGVVVAVLVASCAGVGAWYVATHKIVLLGVDTDAPTTSQIEHYGRFKLPPSAADIHGRLRGFQDHILWVRFTMDPSEEAAFWASTPCAVVASVESAASSAYPDLMQRFDAGPGPPWWSPIPKAAFTARGSNNAIPHSQVIMIDKSDPGRFTVYVYFFEI